MAQRFGGAHSPHQTKKPSYDGARVRPVGARSNVLFAPPIVLAATSLGDGAGGLVLGLIGAGALVLGAWLMREGLIAQAAYDARKIARRPAAPRKLLGALATGIGAGFAAWINSSDPLAALLYGLCAATLSHGAFGFDPMKDKGFDGEEGFQQTRVARVVDEAENHLSAMQAAILETRDRQVEDHVARFIELAREMIRAVENDPRDLSAARKFLGVYLSGARDAAVQFAALYRQRHDPATKQGFLDLLSDLETSFAQKTDRLLSNDAAGLTLEIDVLRERLARDSLPLSRDQSGERPHV